MLLQRLKKEYIYFHFQKNKLSITEANHGTFEIPKANLGNFGEYLSAFEEPKSKNFKVMISSYFFSQALKMAESSEQKIAMAMYQKEVDSCQFMSIVGYPNNMF